MHIGHHIQPQLLLDVSNFLGNHICFNFPLPSEQYGNHTTPKFQRKFAAKLPARVNPGMLEL